MTNTQPRRARAPGRQGRDERMRNVAAHHPTRPARLLTRMGEVARRMGRIASVPAAHAETLREQRNSSLISRVQLHPESAERYHATLGQRRCQRQLRIPRARWLRLLYQRHFGIPREVRQLVQVVDAEIKMNYVRIRLTS